MKIYPHNPNHEKNVKYLNSNKFNEDWFRTAYPDVSKQEMERYFDTTNCDICSSKFQGNILPRRADVRKSKLKGVVCQECYAILSTIKDTEHIKQILDYEKEEL